MKNTGQLFTIFLQLNPILYFIFYFYYKKKMFAELGLSFVANVGIQLVRYYFTLLYFIRPNNHL
jgi:hypothetical protein